MHALPGSNDVIVVGGSKTAACTPVTCSVQSLANGLAFPFAANPDIEPGGCVAVFVRTGVARAFLRGGAVPARVLDK